MMAIKKKATCDQAAHPCSFENCLKRNICFALQNKRLAVNPLLPSCYQIITLPASLKELVVVRFFPVTNLIKAGICIFTKGFCSKIITSYFC